MKKRVIFELDDTILLGKLRVSREFFDRLYGKDSYKINENLSSLISKYEKVYNLMDYNLLSRFLSNSTGLDISPEIVRKWDSYLSNGDYVLDEDTLKLLIELQGCGVSLAILTNWFRDTQINKLERYNLIDLFDDVYTGEGVIKPHGGAYIKTIEDYDRRNSIFVGNDLDNDYIGPRRVGLNSILLDSCLEHHSSVVKIKKIDELRKVVIWDGE